MKELEKLRVLLPHWIEHNNGHEAECTKWAEIAEKEGKEDVAQYITEAVKMMQDVNESLGKALDAAGGPSTEHHHHHQH